MKPKRAKFGQEMRESRIQAVTIHWGWWEKPKGLKATIGPSIEKVIRVLTGIGISLSYNVSNDSLQKIGF